LFFRAPDAASRNPSTSHGKETPDDVPESFPVAQQVQKDTGAAVHAGDMEMFSVTYISDFIARQVLRDACKTCVTPEVLLPANVFIYFKEYSDTEQSLTCGDCWYCYNPNGVYDARGGPLEFSGAAYHSCH
jgi:hypothetical protein